MQSAIESMIHLQVNNVIRDECHCGFQCLINLPDIVCNEQQPNQILYKANIYIYEAYPTDQLVGCIEDWITNGATTIKNTLVIFGHELSITVNGTTKIQPSVALNTSAINPTDHTLMITIPLTAPIVIGFIVAIMLACLWAR